MWKMRKLNISIMIIILFLLISIFSKQLAPNDPTLVNLNLQFLPFSSKYILGTDHLGRCIFSRILIGMRVTFLSSLLVIIVSIFSGVVIGIFSGLSNKNIDIFILRIIDIVDALPSIIIILIIISILGNGMLSLVIGLYTSYLTIYVRLARNLTKKIKEQEFILVAQIMGFSKMKIIFLEVLPNIFHNFIIVGTNDFAKVILSISGYSFLGFGVKSPSSELGMMISEAKDYIYTKPDLIFYPGIVIFLMVLNINILGEKLKKKYENDKK